MCGPWGEGEAGSKLPASEKRQEACGRGAEREGGGWAVEEEEASCPVCPVRGLVWWPLQRGPAGGTGLCWLPLEGLGCGMPLLPELPLALGSLVTGVVMSSYNLGVC